MEATAKRVKKINPASDKEVKILQDALDELQEGMGSLVERQKHIRIADQVKNSWKAVDAYIRAGIGDNEEDNEEDNKRIKLADNEADEEVAQERRSILAYVRALNFINTYSNILYRSSLGCSGTLRSWKMKNSRDWPLHCQHQHCGLKPQPLPRSISGRSSAGSLGQHHIA